MKRVDLRSDGILWMINRTIFHPRGYALSVSEKGNFYVIGDGKEVWRFADEDDDECFAKFEALMNRLR